VIHTDENDMMGAFTFVSERHSKDCAWTEFIEKHAKAGQSPLAIMPGNQIVYFPHDISFTQVA
ncbi:MAG: hypothetical protein VX787_06750, partial [Pseudomonadota bacterium]|nr:hypothetical protein [Pseudomonadota bacterium]